MCVTEPDVPWHGQPDVWRYDGDVHAAAPERLGQRAHRLKKRTRSRRRRYAHQQHLMGKRLNRGRRGCGGGEELGMRDTRMTHTCGSPHQRGCVLVQQRGVLGVHGELERETERVDTRQKGVCGCSNRDVCVRCWMVSWRCPVLRRAGRLSVDDDVEAHVEGGSEKNGCAIINLYVKSLDRKQYFAHTYTLSRVFTDGPDSRPPSRCPWHSICHEAAA